MNNELQLTNPSGIFVTSVVGCYDTKSDNVELVNDGHHPSLLKLSDEKFIEYKSSSVPLGVNKHKDKSIYKTDNFKLESKRLYIFSDGFTESTDEKNKIIGINGVKKLILNFQNPSLKNEIKNIVHSIQQKKKNIILEDDLTIIGLGK